MDVYELDLKTEGTDSEVNLWNLLIKCLTKR